MFCVVLFFSLFFPFWKWFLYLLLRISFSYSIHGNLIEPATCHPKWTWIKLTKMKMKIHLEITIFFPSLIIILSTNCFSLILKNIQRFISNLVHIIQFLNYWFHFLNFHRFSFTSSFLNISFICFWFICSILTVLSKNIILISHFIFENIWFLLTSNVWGIFA